MPRNRSGALPAWHPGRPVGGWSPEAVAESALEYAELNSDRPRDRRRVARAAYLALMAELPSVKRAEIEARLRGEQAGTARELESPEDDGEAPF
ncbi:hypothetical protein [Leifsonia sp. NPDC058248]|uniref:hypothetical protein n=1 Tax=Leifsonia sp. NPDC058248 TaxID=3346402 RepID=UPI0036DA2204